MPRTSLNGGALEGWLLLRFCVVESEGLDCCVAAFSFCWPESAGLGCCVPPEGGARDSTGEAGGGRLGCASGAGCAADGCFPVGAGSVCGMFGGASFFLISFIIKFQAGSFFGCFLPFFVLISSSGISGGSSLACAFGSFPCSSTSSSFNEAMASSCFSFFGNVTGNVLFFWQFLFLLFQAQRG